jgi:hypothetical protein
MFDQRFVEMMKMENRNIDDGCDQLHSFMRPVQFKPSLMERVLPALGEAMISAGLKLKESSHAKQNAERAQSPNYMIMM